LFTQGMVTHAIYKTTDASGRPVYHYPEEVDLRDGKGFVKDTGEEVEIVPSAKMSKSKNNVVDPQAIVAQYGADTARWFVMSDSPPDRDVEWTASGAEAASKHLARVWRMADEIAAMSGEGSGDDELLREMHKAIDAVTKGIDGFLFNTSIARLYGFTNTLAKSKAGAETKRAAMKVMAQLMSPMTPHLAEDIWARLDGEGLVANAAWPVADPKMLVDESVTLPVQVNGKRRDEITVPKDMPKDEIEALALATQGCIRALDGKAPKKVIVVPGRIVNVVA
ncbi:MAG TPA: leucine--tRNA ligase, partial [Rhodobacterales bacterium]|nr:leucine--tRNA ligase [Rhodobacterales bacterium]